MGFDQLSDVYCLSSECLVCLKMFTQFRVLPLCPSPPYSSAHTPLQSRTHSTVWWWKCKIINVSTSQIVLISPRSLALLDWPLLPSRPSSICLWPTPFPNSHSIPDLSPGSNPHYLPHPISELIFSHLWGQRGMTSGREWDFPCLTLPGIF